MTLSIVMSAFRFLHLFGLVVGFGAAIFADLTFFRYGIVHPISDYTIHQVKVLSRAASWGLILLWLSGAGLIYFGYLGDPNYIYNEKLWGKIMIVMILTVNGIILHQMVFPAITAKKGFRLFDGATRGEEAILIFMGMVSLVSWIVPFVLGKAPQLNYITPWWYVMIGWLILLLVADVVASLGFFVIKKIQKAMHITG